MSSSGVTGGGMSNAQRGLIVDLLLFGPQAVAKKGGINLTQSSFAQTQSSGTSGATVSPVYALKYILKTCPIISFEVSTFNADGSRRTESQMDASATQAGDKSGK